MTRETDRGPAYSRKPCHRNRCADSSEALCLSPTFCKSLRRPPAGHHRGEGLVRRGPQAGARCRAALRGLARLSRWRHRHPHDLRGGGQHDPDPRPPRDSGRRSDATVRPSLRSTIAPSTTRCPVQDVVITRQIVAAVTVLHQVIQDRYRCARMDEGKRFGSCLSLRQAQGKARRRACRLLHSAPTTRAAYANGV
jgi:hypothetical protein